MSGKVCTLADGIRRLVRPGMTIHLGYGGGRPNAAVAEIVRRFRGTTPRFTISAHGFVNTQHALLEADLVQRLVVAYAGENYPTPRPNPALQRALREHRVEIENWSLWTLTARLIAGALGVPFLPVRSLSRSSLADEHEGHDFAVLTAFGGPPVGVVRALRPDLVLVQGLAADPEGNVILAPPYGEGAWGALAAGQGVLACVEQIVDSDYIRQHNTLPMIPGHVVRGVCLVPFGSHPYGMSSGGLEGVISYAEDAPFMADLRAAAKDPAALTEWIDRWITGVSDHTGYLDRLGSTRLAAIREGDSGVGESSRTGGATPDERMTLVAARVITERIVATGHDTVLAGIGYSHLAAWIAARRLHEKGYEIELLAELGMAGFRPRPGDPYLFALQNLPTCLQLTDVLDVLGRDVSGPATSCIGVLGAAQIDASGNINSTWASDGSYLVGSGGANDVASAAEELIAVVTHSRSRLVRQVGYITAPGHAVSVIVTSEAVFERRDGEFVLTNYLLDTDERDAVERIRAHTEWDIAVSADIAREPDPATEDLTALRSFDPASVFLRPPRAATGA